MKLIELSKKGKKNKGKYFAKVDDKNFEWLNKFDWCVLICGRTCYAVRRLDKRNVELMHRLILGLTDNTILGDHEDGDGLNNQEYNLRSCSKKQNTRNRRSQLNSTSKYLGVHRARQWCKGRIYYCWSAQITINGKRKTIGRFQDEKEAAMAYDRVAREYYGEFAGLNFK